MGENEQAHQIKKYLLIMIALLLILIIRLAVVQLWENDQYQTRASNNRIRLLPIKAARGEIYTSDGMVLAGNELVYTVSLTMSEMTDAEGEIQKLAALMSEFYPETTAQHIWETLDSMKAQPYTSVAICRKAPWELVVRLEENRRSFPGLSIEIEPLRTYPQGEVAGHVLGYIHSINEEELNEAEEGAYLSDSLIGKTGIEKEYEQELKGDIGARRVEVDSQGHMIQELVTLEAEPGKNLYLTLNSKLQFVMEEKMNEVLLEIQKRFPKARVASAVMLEAKTGKVLAMCSKPDMYPDDWKGNISQERAAYYFPQGTYDPMNPGAATNRAIQSTYPPGSTFKPVTGMAALAAGVLRAENDYIQCNGRYWISPYIRCTGRHGDENYYKAMAVSCNVYFQEAGRRAGHEAIARVGKEFGLGERTGIDLPYEAKGLLPTAEWKKEINATLLNQQYDTKRENVNQKYETLIAEAATEEERKTLRESREKELKKLEEQYKIDYNFDTEWHEYDTFNMSIGQGYNSYTALQLADYVAAIANDGFLMQPYLVEKIVSADGSETQEIQPVVRHQVDIAENVLEETRKGMLQVTRPGGTAYSLFYNFPSDIGVGAKTGTAETGRSGDRALVDCHGVFIAFAPYDDPEVAFAGIVEYGYSGYSSAGMVCKALFEEYFGLADHYSEALASRQQRWLDWARQQEAIAAGE